MTSTTPDSAAVVRAAACIKKRVHRTPVLTSTHIDRLADAKLYFKCENLQRAGAFKIRGATFALANLTAEQARHGVATHSSGNHGAALALAARERGMPAYVVMPETAPAVKFAAVAGYGAVISRCEPSLASREAALAAVLAKTGATFIAPYNHADIIAGQGTAALELCADVADLDCLLAPVGGGGLLSGTALAAANALPTAAIYGAEPAGADDAQRSLRAGSIQPMDAPDTIADGLRSTLGPLTFALIRRHVRAIICVRDEQIIAAMRLLWTRMKIVVEPSAAVPLAAVLASDRFRRRRIGIILSGGNVDLDHLPW